MKVQVLTIVIFLVLAVTSSAEIKRATSPSRRRVFPDGEFARERFDRSSMYDGATRFAEGREANSRSKAVPRSSDASECTDCTPLFVRSSQTVRMKRKRELVHYIIRN